MIIEAMIFGALMTFLLLGIWGFVEFLTWVSDRLPKWAKPIMFWLLLFVFMSLAAYFIKLAS